MATNKKAPKTTPKTAANHRSARGLHPNTELCIDLKTLTRQPGRMDEGIVIPGLLTRDSEDHYTFIQTLLPSAGKRNPRVFDGRCITVTIKDDGTPRLNFKPLKETESLDVDTFANAVADELRRSLSNLLGNKASRKLRNRNK